MEYPQDQHDWITSHYYNNLGPNGIKWELPIDCDYNGERIKLAEMVKQGIYRFKGWNCTAGLKRLYVDVDGEIYRCTKQVGGSLGNINTVWKLPDDNIVCDTDKDCACKLETIISKWI
jgi:MoaA/NifB/PqqE/SkfB family radical SAM enzyme